MCNINLAVTGFYGTGSSAVLDLLKEYEEIQVVPYSNASYEHIAFYYSGGLFDLCSLLTRGNTPYSSDRVVYNFVEAMKKLNNYDYFWFGSYKKLFGNDFMKICTDFVEEISTKREGISTNHIVKSTFSPIKAFLQFGLRLIKGKKYKKYGIKYIYDTNHIYSSLVPEEKLYASARTFTSKYMDLFNKFTNKSIKVFDHLIWAPQIDAFGQCFDNNFKTIVVDRDPRDVYLFDHFIWNRPPFTPKEIPSHFPTDIHEFAEEWKRTVYKPKDTTNCLFIHFEDLVYNYDETIKRIELFIGTKLTHVSKSAHFDKNKSIENTQLFKCNEEWEKIGNLISRELPEFIYNFPYDRKPNQKKMFDR